MRRKEGEELNAVPTGRKRIPVHKANAMAFSKKPGFVRRLVNETYGRVQKFLDAGYTIVEDETANQREPKAQDASNLGSPVRQVVNKGRDATANTAILMEIPEEYYKENQAEKQKRLDEIDAQMDPKHLSKDPNSGVDYGSISRDYRG